MKKANRQNAFELLKEGRFEDAYTLFKTLVRQHPEDWRLYDSLAYIEINLRKDFGETRRLIEKAKELGCPEEKYHRVCADILWAQGQLREAVAEFEKAAGCNKSIENMVALANSLMKTDWQRAEAVWQEILEEEPGNVLAMEGLAWIARKKGEWAKALKMAADAKRLQPNDADILFGLGQAYQGLGEYEKALEQYAEAEKLESESEGKFYLHGNIANCYRALKNFPEAIEHAYQAAQIKPEDNRVKELLEECREYILWLYGENRYAEAYPMMKTALKIWPDDSRLLACMACLEMAFKHDYDSGKSYIDKAFQYSNTDLDLLYQVKGVLWFDHLSQKDEGLEYLGKAVSLNRRPSNLLALASRIVDTELERAEELCREASKSEPENVQALYVLAHVTLRKRDIDKALELAEKAYSLQPDNPDVNSLLAAVYVEQGKYEESLKFYLKALELGSKDNVYLYNSIALCYEKLGDLIKARDYAKKVLELDHDNPEAKRFFCDST